jgi:hypothetical protein
MSTPEPSARTKRPRAGTPKRPWIDWAALSAVRTKPSETSDEPELQRPTTPWRPPGARSFERRK